MARQVPSSSAATAADTMRVERFSKGRDITMDQLACESLLDEEVSSMIRQAITAEIDRKRHEGLPVVVNRGQGAEVLVEGEY